MKKVTEKKKFRLKKSARLTIAGVCAATAVVVAAIPTKNVEAITNYDTEIPVSVDEVIGIDPATGKYVPGTEIERLIGDANTVVPNDTNKHWAFPVESVYDQVDDTAVTHRYYRINTADMSAVPDPVPVFEISATSTPVSTQPQCIKHYVGGDGSGYSPSGGILALSQTVCYDNPGTPGTGDNYWYTRKGDPALHQPWVVEHYIEKLVEHEPNNNMIDVYGGVLTNTPSYYYYDITIERWTRVWTQDPYDPNIWHEPTMPGAGDPPDEYDAINGVCKEQSLVKYIGNNAFEGVANFTEMQIIGDGAGGGITYIGDNAFKDCTNLQKINFGSDFRFLGTKAFYNCSALSEIDFGMATESIGDGCFADCTLLSNVSLPNSLTKLGTGAFMNCRNLVDTIPDHKTADDSNSVLFGGNPGINSPLVVGSYAFCNCTSLERTKMCQTSQPITGTYGQYGMYAGCTNLKQIELPHYTAAWQPTKSTFLGCNNLECVRGNNYTDTSPDWLYQNSTNEQYVPTPPGYSKNVSDSFVVWGPNPNESPSIALLDFAQRNTIPYMYYDKSDDKYKYIMVIDNTYKFTFTDAFEVESITEIPAGTSTTLTIPASIGGHNITSVLPDACGRVDHGTYITNLTKPKEIIIADAIADIGENAFRNCKSVETVAFKHIPFTTQAAQTSIGANCFKDCSNLELVKFRDDDFSGNGYYDINIDASSVGTDAFLTETASPKVLTMLGKMEPGYWPFEYALNPDNRYCSTENDSYINYRSGNPQNLECRYFRPDASQPGYVSLVSYPTVNTVVGEDASGDVTISDLIDKYLASEILSPNQNEIINGFTTGIYVPGGITSIAEAGNDLGLGNDYFISTNDPGNRGWDLANLVFESVDSLPDVTTDANKPFAECRGLQTITFNGNVKDIGTLPFYNVSDLLTDPTSALLAVYFNGENEKSTATIDDPYYWYDNGIIYSYYVDDDGKGVTTLEEVLQSRGNGVGMATVDLSNDPSLAEVTNIAEEAFQNCDHVDTVDLSGCTNLKVIPDKCFYNCNHLETVILPENIREVHPGTFQEDENLDDVWFYGKSLNIDEDAFYHTKSSGKTYLHGYIDSLVEPYVKMVNKKEHRATDNELFYKEIEPSKIYCTVSLFEEKNGKSTPIGTFQKEKGTAINEGDIPSDLLLKLSKVPPEEWYFYGHGVSKWGDIVNESISIVAKNGSSSSSSSSSTNKSSSGGSTGRTSGSSGTSGTGGTTANTSSSNGSSRSTSITSTTVQPVYVSGTSNPIGAIGSHPAAVATGTGASGGSGGTGKTNNNVGKTKLISTTGGITDTSKMSATVNGSSDNYVIKITETQEANEMADQALLAAFGSLDAIRYLPIDISLYDSTGTEKISPIPEGMSINITMPIPDKLAIYGGNAKIACTEGGTLDKIVPKFTVINGVPCMNYTVTHLSPYVVYVDTNNLVATGTLDSTPKTGDPIHPKWFLVIGLAAVSGIMFLKRDKKEMVEAA